MEYVVLGVITIIFISAVASILLISPKQIPKKNITYNYLPTYRTGDGDKAWKEYQAIKRFQGRESQ